MIAYVKGIIEEISSDNIVIDVNGIGYNIKVSESTAASVGNRGSVIKLFTYTHVREDAFSLFGFKTREDLELFKLLLTVSGVGPKGALAVLSVLTANDLRFAIAAGDAKTISRAPGIGKRTAERIVLDLRDKLSADISSIDTDNGFSAALSGVMEGIDNDSSIRTEVVEALVSLGYSGQEAMKAISKVDPKDCTDSGTMLKAALKFIY